MNTLVDILIVVFLGLGAYAGWKRGLIKSLVNFIGLLAVLIISYYLRGYLAPFLIDKMPFLTFGALGELSSLNILIYNIISFIVIFILLYCVLNVIISITGFIDTLLKFTVIWILPSKIFGAVVGFLEAWVYVYLVLFLLGAVSFTSSYVLNSKGATFLLDHTPLVGTIMGRTKNAIAEIYTSIDELSKDENTTTKDLNLRILQIEISYGLVTKEKAQELTDTGKIELGKVLFGEEDSLWLNI